MNTKRAVFLSLFAVFVVVGSSMAAPVDCAKALENCKSKWWMPDWGCENLYEQCMGK
jgi:hypothetical protein